MTKTRQSRLWLCLFVLTVLATAGALVWLPNGEPVVRGRTLGYWVRELRTPEHRDAARSAICEIGPEAIPLLLKRVRAHDALARRLCREAWVSAQGNLHNVMPRPQPLDEAFHDDVTDVAARLGWAAVPLLLFALDDTNLSVRRVAITAIGRIGPDAGAAVPALIEILKSRNPALQGEVWDALVKLKSSATPALTELLQGHSGDRKVDPSVAWAAQSILWKMIVEYRPHERWLGFDDSDGDNRIRAAEALWRAHPSTNLLPLFISGIGTTSDPSICADCIRILGEMGPAARTALPALVSLITNQVNGPTSQVPLVGLPELARDSLREIDPVIAAGLDLQTR